MRKISEDLNKIIFRMKWFFWTPDEKYAYLWGTNARMNKRFIIKIGRFTGKEV
jgi:hypothetical protein